MLIHRLPDILSWTRGTDDLQSVHDAYMYLLLSRWEDEADEHLVDLRAQVGESAFTHRFLGAPETSHRLLWPKGSAWDRSRVFETSLRTELALAGGDSSFREESWTALGDAAILPGGQRFHWPQAPNMMPLDFGSPGARAIDLSGVELEVAVPREPYGIGDLEAALRKVREALQGVMDACPDAGGFVARFNKVLVLQPDRDTPRKCCSGSNGQFVGRSFVTNVQSAEVTTAAVADAVVHEGIHGLMYMQQLLRPWGVPELVYDQRAAVKSPWTGRLLPLRSFLEACFVWYGLLHFWCHALRNDAFDPAGVQKHLARALRGFLKQPLIDLFEEHRGMLLPDLTDSVISLQTRVQAGFST